MIRFNIINDQQHPITGWDQINNWLGVGHQAGQHPGVVARSASWNDHFGQSQRHLLGRDPNWPWLPWDPKGNCVGQPESLLDWLSKNEFWWLQSQLLQHLCGAFGFLMWKVHWTGMKRAFLAFHYKWLGKLYSWRVAIRLGSFWCKVFYMLEFLLKQSQTDGVPFSIPLVLERNAKVEMMGKKRWENSRTAEHQLPLFIQCYWNAEIMQKDPSRSWSWR